jgi:alanyl-tRNA synthetase
MPLSSAEARQAFLDYFRQQGHTIVASSSLIPVGDPTLLFTNAGMVQFKDVFLGLEKRAYTRATTAQKCMRVSGKHNDLENVGPSPRHHTFFEMLGNFSFGDYFKRDAIRFAFECVTKVYGTPADRLVYTVYQGDEEALSAWEEFAGVPRSAIIQMEEKTNFWMMGDTGPCGPTSELHYDWGPECCTCGEPGCSVALDNGCERWLEIWNLVFMQFNQAADGTRTPLPRTGADTGMGLERILSVINGVRSNYETDLFQPIMQRTRELLGHSEQEMKENLVAYRVIADHGRAVTFLIGDGVLPANEGRGYALRMILRRAARYGKKIGFDGPFLGEIARTVMEIMGGHYRELITRRDFILDRIAQEENRFQQTLNTGLSLLDEIIERLGKDGQKVIPGDEAFRLYDTYGFPLDLTRDVAREHGLTVDEPGFHGALKAQKERARRAQQFVVTDADILERYHNVLSQLQEQGLLGPGGVQDDPYAGTEAVTSLAALLKDGQPVEAAGEGDEVELVLPLTRFYTESGGQVSDTGHIASCLDGGSSPAWEVNVRDIRKPVPGLLVHIGRVTRGSPRIGDKVQAIVDYERRRDIMRNHTATHLLHRQLREVLGQHVQQAGSLVAPDRLRFDFTHGSTLSREELSAIEEGVNEAILADYPVRAGQTTYKEAVDKGAMALFGEKYGEVVRMIEIGEPEAPFSRELCGGTHVSRTGEIILFHILSESSIGAGLRRIEAVTGRVAQQLAGKRLRIAGAAAVSLGCAPEELDHKVLSLLDRIQQQDKEIARLHRELAQRDFEEVLSQIQEVEGARVLAAQVQATGFETLREMSDWFRGRVRSGIIVLGAILEDRPGFVAAVTPDLVERGIDAGWLVKAVAAVVGGGGGGRPTLAQAGGRDASRIGEALKLVPELVRERLSRGKYLYPSSSP